LYSVLVLNNTVSTVYTLIPMVVLQITMKDSTLVITG
jgi:hypothetical protein